MNDRLASPRTLQASRGTVAVHSSQRQNALRQAECDRVLPLHCESGRSIVPPLRSLSPSRSIYLKPREDRSSRKEKDYSFRTPLLTPALPKKARSAYIFYCLKHRSRIQGQNESISPVEVSRRLGAEWNALSPEEREVVASSLSQLAIQEDGGGGSSAVSSRSRGARDHHGRCEALHAKLHGVGLSGEVRLFILLFAETRGDPRAEQS